VLEELRWPDGPRCLRCDSDKISRIHERNQFDCDSCRYQFSVTAGTIFHDSHLGLPKWFVATYLICESKKGISANQMKRVLGVSYKTAWYLCHRIRAAMKDTDAHLLTGIVEADETYVGGRQEGVGRGNWRRGKTMVLGAVERDGEVRLKVDKRASKKIVHTFLESAVDDEAERFYTDEHGAYEDFAERHEHVVHGQEEWVRGQVHTNTMESIWSLLKRSIIGSYHHLSARHLPAYLDEMAFRYNNRRNPYLFRDTLMKLIGAEGLPYQQLVSPDPR
jgi:transposase-like protein